ncbi:MAG: HEAT repeat domain-containing protein [Tepidisphaeraceae bacterium]
MRSSTTIAVSFGVLVGAIAVAQVPVQDSVDATVRKLLKDDHWTTTGSLRELLRLGDKAFPTYEQILREAGSSRLDVERVFYLINRTDSENRRHFVPLAIKGALGEHPIQASELLGEIGEPDDAAVLLALLSHSRLEARLVAARAIAKIGTAKERAWLQAWLEEQLAPVDQDVKREVQNAINMITTRLVQEKGREMGSVTESPRTER